MAKTLTIEVPDDAFSILRTTPEEFGRELCLAAAIQWCEMGRISQEQAAELAGMSRAAFIEALSRHGVSVLQTSANESEQDMYAELGGHG